MYDALGQVRKKRKNLGCQFVLPAASKFKNPKRQPLSLTKNSIFFAVANATLEPQAPQAPSAAGVLQHGSQQEARVPSAARVTSAHPQGCIYVFDHPEGEGDR